MITIIFLCALELCGQAAATPTLARTIKGDKDGLQGKPDFSDDGRWFATASFGYDNGRAKVYPRSGGKFGQPSVLEKSAGGVNVVRFSGDSKTLATGNADGTVGIYTTKDYGKWSLLHQLSDAKDVVYSIAYSANQKWFASGSRDKLVRVYGIENATIPQLKYTLSDAASGEVGFIFTVAFSADSKWLGSGCWDGKLRIYDMSAAASPPLSYTLQIGTPSPSDPTSVSSIAFSANGLWLAIGSTDNHVRLYAFNGTAAPSLLSDEAVGSSDGGVTGVTFSRDSRWLAVSTEEDKVRVYSLEKGALDLAYQLDDYPRDAEADGVAFDEVSKMLAVVWGSNGASGDLIYSGFQAVDVMTERFV